MLSDRYKDILLPIIRNFTIFRKIFLYVYNMITYYMKKNMKKILFVILLFSLPSISYGNIFTQINSRDIKIEYITYTVGSEIYDLKVWLSDDVATISAISRDYWAISGINWVFFCPADYSACKWKNYTINERFEDWIDLSFYPDTGERGVFWWDQDTIPFIHQTWKINSSERNNIFEWLGNFPILYANGKNMLEYYHDVWLYDAKMSASMKRHFICSNKEKTEIFFGSTSSTSLDNLAPALYDIWCWDGLNLDAWASTYFNYNWRELEKWSRKVLDGFFIVPKTFDAIAINKKLDSAMPEITRVFKRYPKQSALAKITAVREYLKKYRWDMYETYSKDIFDSNGDLNWYSLEVTDTYILQKIYLFNILDIELKKLYNSISSSTS